MLSAEYSEELVLKLDDCDYTQRQVLDMAYQQGRADAEKELKEDTSITLRFLATELMKKQINYSEDTCHYFSKGIQAFVIKLENFIAEQLKE